MAKANEERWQAEQLTANEFFEGLLHDHFKQDKNSDRSVLSGDIIPIDLLGTKSCVIKAFVIVRLATSSTDPNFKDPKAIGKVANLKEVIAKLAHGPEARLSTDEETWLFLALKYYKSPVILPAEVEDKQQETPADDEHTDKPSPVMTRAIDASGHSIIDNPSLLLEASQRFADNMVHTNVKKHAQDIDRCS